jgi:hypothetical protein
MNSFTKSIGFALAFGASVAYADEKEADDCLRNKIWAGYESGWAVRTATTISLEEDAHRVFLVTLYQGNEYKLMVCGDKDSKNLDIVLHDTKGTEIQRDQDESAEPLLTFTPSETQTYYVAVYAASVSDEAESTGVAFAVTYK